MHRRQDAEATTDVVGALDAATRAIASLQSVDDVLQVIVDQVRLLVRADYAALGTVHGHGEIEAFITSGMSRETRAAIGRMPTTHIANRPMLLRTVQRCATVLVPRAREARRDPVIPIELMVAAGAFVIALALGLRWLLTQII